MIRTVKDGLEKHVETKRVKIGSKWDHSEKFGKSWPRPISAGFGNT
jgi:hypothetical protein